MNQLRVAIHGAAGRMGQRLVALASADDGLKLVAALESPRHPQLGQDAGTLAGVGELGLPLSDRLASPADVVIDFSTPEATAGILATCRKDRIALVVATTGLAEAQQKELREAAKTIPLLWAPNMSFAVNLAMKLTEIASAALKNHAGGADVEIVERHGAQVRRNRRRRDGPDQAPARSPRAPRQAAQRRNRIPRAASRG